VLDIDDDRERLAAILACLPDGLVILAPDTRVVEVNECFCTMTGFAREAIVGRRSLFPHWPEEERPRLEAVLAECVTTGAAERDVVLPRRDGTRFPAIVSAATARASDGAIGAYVVTVKDVTVRLRAERVRSALRRIGALVSTGAPVDAVLDAVARELARLTEGGTGRVTRGAEEAVVVASSGRSTAGDAPPALSAPIDVAGREWGVLTAGAPLGRRLPERLGDAVEAMAGMVASAIVAEDARALVIARAGADPVLGLPDARAFSELTRREWERAGRYGRPLSLVLLDIDGFRQVNEIHGQAAGDGVLREVAERLAVHVRSSDWVGRTGSDEYAWLLPETDEDAARDAAARLRRALAEEPFPGVGCLTASLGVSSSASAEGATDLYRQAEVALHWAKVSGRNRVVPYSFHVAEEVFSRRGAERAEAPSLRAMRALAWAVDAKDPHTHRHSARVADLAVRLATALGWTITRAAQLREAGLVHDVGKIAVPDAILFKPGPLTAQEYAQMASHAEIGAQIVADVLSPEQAAWVRAHHERWDGGGYPDGLTGDEIPEEARLLTLADCWDVIVSSRSYKPSSSTEEALAEVGRCSGSQFWPVAVGALERLVAAGAVGAAEDPVAPVAVDGALLV
jgi:diguanylate cyclase (GGDEF)-like protein/PAS domain S-box-containing protein